MRQQDLDNALKRMLIKMYDHNRAEKAYNPDNCKHLACSEVRASLFNSQCKPLYKTNLKKIRNSTTAKEKEKSNEFCMREIAIAHLQEKSKCKDKADRYVDYVWERCKNDRAPITGGKAAKLKSFNDIM